MFSAGRKWKQILFTTEKKKTRIPHYARKNYGYKDYKFLGCAIFANELANKIIPHAISNVKLAMLTNNLWGRRWLQKEEYP